MRRSAGPQMLQAGNPGDGGIGLLATGPVPATGVAVTGAAVTGAPVTGADVIGAAVTGADVIGATVEPIGAQPHGAEYSTTARHKLSWTKPSSPKRWKARHVTGA